MVRYPVGSSGQILVLSDAVLRHFEAHRQLRPRDAEAGGQLFARFSEPEILVEEATGPRPLDRRARTSYRPHRKSEQREIDERHASGLHFIGDWHTHPSPYPTPSGEDLRSIADCVARSRHDYNGFIMIVVGTAPPPAGLWVSLHDGERYLALNALIVDGG